MADTDGMFQVISGFQDIVLQKETLYVLDFDETIAYFEGIHKGWWKDRFEHHCEHNDHDIAEELALKDWMKHVTYVDPTHVDKDGFENIVKYCVSEPSSRIVILTARNKKIEVLSQLFENDIISLENVTEAHMKIISPDHDIDIIFYSGDHKGYVLQDYLDKHDSEYQHIICIDDLRKNLVDFKSVHSDSQCYHMLPRQDQLKQHLKSKALQYKATIDKFVSTAVQMDWSTKYPINGYKLFVRENGKQIDDSINIGKNRIFYVNEAWKNLSREEQQHYNERATNMTRANEFKGLEELIYTIFEQSACDMTALMGAFRKSAQKGKWRDINVTR